jgi:hypothetical protein
VFLFRSISAAFLACASLAAADDFRMELVDRAMKLAQARLASEAGEAARRRWVENGIKSLQAGAVARA